jgi:hypothetical protein
MHHDSLVNRNMHVCALLPGPFYVTFNSTAIRTAEILKRLLGMLDTANSQESKLDKQYPWNK